MDYSQMSREELLQEVELLRSKINELEAIYLQFEQSEQALLEARDQLSRLNEELQVEIMERERFEKALSEYAQELGQKNRELEEAHSRIKVLSGLLPVCSSCKSVRDDHGYWKRLESSLQEHSEAQVSHTLCMDCVKKLYPDQYEKLAHQFSR